MPLNSKPSSSLRTEIATLRAQLTEAQEMLQAIRRGEVDALVVEGVTGPQVYTLQGLDAETNRFRGQILAQISDAVIARDTDERVIYLNAAAEQLYGVTPSRVLGEGLSEIYVARWRIADGEALAVADLQERGEWRGENVHVTHDGRELQVESRVTLMRGNTGKPTGLLAVIRDVTERNKHEDKVRVSEIRYRRLFEAAHDGVLIIDAGTGKIIEANPFMTRMLGYPHDYLIGKELFEIGLLKDEAASREMFQKLKRTNEVRYDNLPLEGRAGQHHEVEVVANLYDENGRSVIQCNIRDITERKRSEEHVKLLMAEVNHRAKNLLAVVHAMAQQTAKHGDPATFTMRLSDRIAGLAAGQDLLVRTEWQGIEVLDLVEAQLAHFHELIGTRVLLQGPLVRLAAAPAQGIGMALHELATNAAKYGALSNREGKVHIHWQLTGGRDPIFSMSWLECDGPKVEAPTRKGFGQVVIGRMAEAAVNGSAAIDFRQDGLTWNLSAQAEDVVAPPVVRLQ
jgi:PAS domain S-box-containing protein